MSENPNEWKPCVNKLLDRKLTDSIVFVRTKSTQIETKVLQVLHDVLCCIISFKLLFHLVC